jgi:TetR/AcrR family transcriptional regulator
MADSSTAAKNAPARGRGRPARIKDQDEDAAGRRRILEAALETFSQLGFEGASITEIARRHGVSPPLIHYYFKNKMELWREAAKFGAGSMVQELQERMNDLADTDSVSRLKFFIRRYIALLVERPDVFRLLVREGETPGQRLKWLLQQYFHPLYETFEDAVRATQKEGRIKSHIPSYHVCQIIAGACYQFIASRNRMIELYDVDPTSRAAREQHASFVIEVLMSGLEVRP